MALVVWCKEPQLSAAGMSWALDHGVDVFLAPYVQPLKNQTAGMNARETYRHVVQAVMANNTQAVVNKINQIAQAKGVSTGEVRLFLSVCLTKLVLAA